MNIQPVSNKFQTTFAAAFTSFLAPLLLTACFCGCGGGDDSGGGGGTPAACPGDQLNGLWQVTAVDNIPTFEYPAMPTGLESTTIAVTHIQTYEDPTPGTSVTCASTYFVGCEGLDVQSPTGKQSTLTATSSNLWPTSFLMGGVYYAPDLDMTMRVGGFFDGSEVVGAGVFTVPFEYECYLGNQVVAVVDPETGELGDGINPDAIQVGLGEMRVTFQRAAVAAQAEAEEPAAAEAMLEVLPVEGGAALEGRVGIRTDGPLLQLALPDPLRANGELRFAVLPDSSGLFRVETRSEDAVHVIEGRQISGVVLDAMLTAVRRDGARVLRVRTKAAEDAR